MTLTNTIVAKLAVAFVAVAMMFSLVAPAQAQTAEELQATIDALMAQIAALNSQIGGITTSSASSVCPYTWTRTLNTGATGADVMMLQKFLNSSADTQVSVSGAGAPGMETDYYGPATGGAVAKFQAKYRTDILSPLGLVNPTTYFGPSTMAKANALCVTAPATDDSDDSTDDSDDSTDDSDDSVTLSGEASLKEATLDDASDTDVEEGAEDAEIAEFTVEFEDGDAEISRIDVSFDTSAIGATTDPWDLLETVSLWVDGDKVAEEDADREGDYLSDDKTIRFTNLDLVAMEDEELEIIIAATIQGGIDSGDQGDVTVTIDSMRFFDADGVATTENDPANPDTATFTVEEEGVDDELIVKTSSNDPDAATLQVEDDRKSDWYTVFVFDLDTDDSPNDIELNEIPLTVTLSTSTYAARVDDAELVIDGVTIDDVTVTGSGPYVLTFDVDGDVVIDAGDRVEAELMLRFKSLPASFEGMTVDAKITAGQADAILAEGADDLDATKLSGSATGDAHTLRTSGIDVSKESTSAVVTTQDGDTNDYATLEIEVEVTAFEQDVYLSTDPAVSTMYSLRDGAGNLVSVGTSTAVLTSTADENTGYYEVTEGETETFTLTITYVPGAANTAVRLRLDSLEFAATAVVPDQSQTTLPITNYRTAVVTIVN